jgi:hypothetical protein
VGDLVGGSCGIGCNHLVVYEPEKPLGLMIVKRTSPGSPVSSGRLLGLKVIATVLQTVVGPHESLAANF